MTLKRACCCNWKPHRTGMSFSNKCRLPIVLITKLFLITMPSDRSRKKITNSAEILGGVGMPRNVSDYAENTQEYVGKFQQAVIKSEKNSQWNEKHFKVLPYRMYNNLDNSDICWIFQSYLLTWISSFAQLFQSILAHFGWPFCVVTKHFPGSFSSSPGLERLEVKT